MLEASGNVLSLLGVLGDRETQRLQDGPARGMIEKTVTVQLQLFEIF